MKLEEFYVETWMTDHENDCLYNLTDTCVTCMSLNELQQLCNNNIIDDLMNIRVDYGPIVGSNRLKNAVLGLYETGSIDNLTMTTGAINANELVLMTLLNPGDSVLTMLPTYQQLYSFPASLGCSVDFVELKEEDNWLPNIEDFKNKVSKKTKLICLNSPNNPTGTFITKQLMLEIIDIAKENDVDLENCVVFVRGKDDILAVDISNAGIRQRSDDHDRKFIKSVLFCWFEIRMG